MRFVFLAFSMLCIVGFSASAQTDCGWNPDVDGDNAIGIADLLALLGVFSQEDLDDDGIWGDEDDCLGIVDECGVCNGPGPDFPVIESIEFIYDSVFIPQIEEWYVFEIGADTTFSYVCPTPGCTDPDAGNYNPDAVIDDGTCIYGPEECGGSTTVTFDGYTYDLVAIGSQCWFAENLRTEHYANGDAIPGNLTGSEWESTFSGAQAIYDNEVANLAAYGRLYNWYAVDDSRSLCPSGWHVPTDGEWTELTDFMGGSSVAGTVLKSSPSDNPSWDGTNTSGFSALPGGVRSDSNGSFFDGGDTGYWWSASPYGTSVAWRRRLYNVNGYVNRGFTNLGVGLSVRCLRDE